MSHACTAGLSRPKVALWVLCGLAAPAWGTPDGAGLAPPGSVPRINPAADAAGQLFEFDIPAQPLAAALDRYAALSKRPALFRSEIVAGRTSSAVLGRYAPDAALHLLLEGTGLDAESVDSGPAKAFVLKEIEAPIAAPRPAAGTLDSLAGAGDYGGLVQTRVWEALCGDSRTTPGDYRSLLRFRVDTTGRIYGARLLGSSGDASRDAALLETLQHVRIDGSPPVDMAQPLTMIVLPRVKPTPTRFARPSRGGTGGPAEPDPLCPGSSGVAVSSGGPVRRAMDN